MVEPRLPNAHATKTLRAFIRLQELRKIQWGAKVAQQRSTVEKARQRLQQAEQDLADAIDVERRQRIFLNIEYLQQNASVTRLRNWAAALRECVSRTKECKAYREKTKFESDVAAAELAEREAALRHAMREIEKFTYLLKNEFDN
ncbi:hypothetical protein WI25_03960 [Burkholderia cepacia]|nr:hypothetical protein WI25_03960 [Burkholderia cepacia]